MCDELEHNHAEEHEEEHHHHDGTHECCSKGEDYERFLQEERLRTVSRRTLLKRLSLGAAALASSSLGVTNVFASNISHPLGVKAAPFVAEGNDDFLYLSGDHHIHTKFSSDAKYSVQRQVAEANNFGLNWMVITDHGSKTHNKLGIDQTIPEIVRSRDAFKNMLVFSGMELNIPGAEHGTVMMMPGPKELELLRGFEASFDGSIAPNTEQRMLEALYSLNALDPKPLFFANHPSRRGLDSPHEFRNWKLTAPDVVMGYEGAPGHQAASLVKDADGKYVNYRGYYGGKPIADSHTFFGPETYYTYGGFDYMTAKLGGLWDSLLGDGLRWWITANSDSHTYFFDLQDRDDSKFNDTGYIVEVDKYFQRPVYGDFAPGQYSRTYVVTNDRSYAGVMAGIRQGNMFVVHGDLIDQMRFYASGKAPGEVEFGGVGVLTGGTFVVKRGSDVRFQIRFRTPKAPNNNNERPRVDHFDLIAGEMNMQGYVPGNSDLMTNPSTKVYKTWTAGDWRASETATGYIVEAEFVFKNIQTNFYARLRGTNTNDYGATPAQDPDMRGKTGPAETPWEDLWFYTNPIFVIIQD